MTLKHFVLLCFMGSLFWAFPSEAKENEQGTASDEVAHYNLEPPVVGSAQKGKASLAQSSQKSERPDVTPQPLDIEQHPIPQKEQGWFLHVQKFLSSSKNKKEKLVPPKNTKEKPLLPPKNKIENPSQTQIWQDYRDGRISREEYIQQMQAFGSLQPSTNMDASK